MQADARGEGLARSEKRTSSSKNTDARDECRRDFHRSLHCALKANRVTSRSRSYDWSALLGHLPTGAVETLTFVDSVGRNHQSMKLSLARTSVKRSRSLRERCNLPRRPTLNFVSSPPPPPQARRLTNSENTSRSISVLDNDPKAIAA